MPRHLISRRAWLRNHESELLVRTMFQCLHASRGSTRHSSVEEIVQQGTYVFKALIREYARLGEHRNVTDKDATLVDLAI